MKMQWAAGVMAVVATAAVAQQLAPVAEFPLSEDGLVIRRAVETGEPFTVAGPTGVIVGQQQGVCEVWTLPVKLISGLRIEANVEGYNVPLDLNTMARTIEVRPDRTVITYAHIGVVVRQIMFAPRDGKPDAAPVMLFAVDAQHPVDLVFRFTAEMREMWPQHGDGTPDAEWVKEGASGYYILHTNWPQLSGAVAIPGATPGVLAPFSERPQVHPLEFHLHVDPKRDAHRWFPLLMAVGRTTEAATSEHLHQALVAENADVAAEYARQVRFWQEQEATRTRIVTPDTKFNEAFGWAATSIEQLRTREPKTGETALVAGYYASGDSARPGFGWFFGRDSLYTLYAVNGFGDFALAKSELEFLLARQRDDGKIMHEWSQTASELDWKSFPYMYAAADATPLFLMAMADYVRASGDIEFLRAHKDAVMKAWQFETMHDADGDGIYDNSQGTGWVEGWTKGLPQQEIYMAAIDEEASRAMSAIAADFGDAAMRDAALERAKKIHATLEREYYEPATGLYAFSWDKDHQDTTNSAYPALAWWTPASALAHPEASLRAWASHAFDTDWGMRDVASGDAMYDSMSYHQGSVWPLFTGWAAMAQYGAQRPLAGYAALMQNADLTWAQDPGAVTELLSGDYYEPFGRSTSHQLWSSAMVITPTLRGMFGLEVDAASRSVRVAPQLPAQWDSARIEHLHVGQSVVNLAMKREGRSFVVTLESLSGSAVTLQGAAGNTLRLPLPAVEAGIQHSLPQRGERTHQMKVLSQKAEEHSLTLELEGVSGSDATLFVRRNVAVPGLKATGAVLDGDGLRVHFAGTAKDYVAQTVTLRW